MDVSPNATDGAGQSSEASYSSPPEQGSSGTEFNIADDIASHINRGHQEGTPPEGEQITEPIEPVESESTRYQKRIDELTGRTSEQERQLEAFQLMIASNPTMRKAYEEMTGIAQQPQYAAQQQQQFYQAPQEQERLSLPDWDPDNEDVVRQHAQIMVRQELAPVVNALVGEIQQLKGHLHSQQSVVQDQVAGQLDNLVMAELPGVKDDPVLTEITKAVLRSNFAQLTPAQRNSWSDVEKAARTAIQTLQQKLRLQGGTQVQQQPGIPAPSPRVFSESRTNLVAPQDTQKVQTIADSINAHMSFHAAH